MNDESMLTSIVYDDSHKTEQTEFGTIPLSSTHHDTAIDPSQQPPTSLTACPRAKSQMNLHALNGLRGFIVIYIVIYHLLYWIGDADKVFLDTLGAALMPFFFVISGYVLAINETLNPTTKRNFYQRRFARTIPLYYLVNIVTVGLIYVGYWNEFGEIPKTQMEFYVSYILTVFAATTWFGFTFSFNTHHVAIFSNTYLSEEIRNRQNFFLGDKK